MTTNQFYLTALIAKNILAIIISKAGIYFFGNYWSSKADFDLGTIMLNKIYEAMPQVRPESRIAIFGGSFDPPHLCHQLLALSILALEPIDSLWIIPCADHPFRKTLSPFDLRLEMCRQAFSHFDHNVHVTALEGHLSSPNYTVETLKIIKKQYPKASLYLALGSDIISQIENWFKYEELADLCEVIAFSRAGFPINELDKKKNIRFHQGFELPDISSTNLREQLATAKSSAKLLLDQKVLKFIVDKGLYL